MLGARNSSQMDELYTRGKNEEINLYYISQSNFGSPRQSIRNNSDSIKLFKQTLTHVESMYKGIGGYDMIYFQFREMCRKAWSEEFNYLCIDMSKSIK